MLAEVKSQIEQAVEQGQARLDESKNPVNKVSNLNVNIADERIAKLRAELTQLEQTTRSGSALKEAPDSNADIQTQPLRKQVEQAFDVRQQLQQLEADKLRLKLQIIESNLESRQKNRDRIIDSRVRRLQTSNDFSNNKTPGELETGVQLLAFTANYAAPCQQMMPILKSLETQGFPIQILEITSEYEKTRRYKIERVPTFIVTRDGDEVERMAGVTSEAELRRALNGAISTRQEPQLNPDYKALPADEATGVKTE